MILYLAYYAFDHHWISNIVYTSPDWPLSVTERGESGLSVHVLVTTVYMKQCYLDAPMPKNVNTYTDSIGTKKEVYAD